jgi:hypothetical protein
MTVSLIKSKIPLETLDEEIQDLLPGLGSEVV